MTSENFRPFSLFLGRVLYDKMFTIKNDRFLSKNRIYIGYSPRLPTEFIFTPRTLSSKHLLIILAAGGEGVFP